MPLAPNQEINDIYKHPEGTTGLMDGDFTKRLFKNGTPDAITVTVTETATGGYYSVAWTPDDPDNDVDFWYLNVFETGNEAASDREYEYEVGYDSETVFLASTTAGTTVRNTHALNTVNVNNADFTADSFEHLGRTLTFTSGAQSGNQFTALYVDSNKIMYISPAVEGTGTVIGSGDAFTLSAGKSRPWIPYILGTVDSGGTGYFTDSSLNDAFTISDIDMHGKRAVFFDISGRRMRYTRIGAFDTDTVFTTDNYSFAAGDRFAILEEESYDYDLIDVDLVDATTASKTTFVARGGINKYEENEFQGCYIQFIDGSNRLTVRRVLEHGGDLAPTWTVDEPFFYSFDDGDSFKILRKYDSKNNYDEHDATQTAVGGVDDLLERLNPHVAGNDNALTCTYVDSSTISVSSSYIELDNQWVGAEVLVHCGDDFGGGEGYANVSIHGKIVACEASTGNITIQSPIDIPDFSGWTQAVGYGPKLSFLASWTDPKLLTTCKFLALK